MTKPTREDADILLRLAELSASHDLPAGTRMSRYWLVVYTPEHFDITRRSGFDILGFKESHRTRVELVSEGDRFLLYASGGKGFGAVCRAESRMFTDRTPRWTSGGQFTRPGEIWPLRVRTTPLVDLRGRWVPARSVWGKTGYFSGPTDGPTLGGKFISALRSIDEASGQRAEEAMRRAAPAARAPG